MATETSRRIPIEKAASKDEIFDALSSLTPIQYKKLERYARWRINGLGRKKLHRDWDDLLHMAIVSFCIEHEKLGRRWDKDQIDFVKALTEAMRSISNRWRNSFKEEEPFREADLITTSPEGQESNPLDKIASSEPSAQEEVERDEILRENQAKIQKIEKLLVTRELASLIFMGMQDEMTGKQIREDLGLSQVQYETEMKWIRRTVRAAFKEEGQ